MKKKQEKAKSNYTNNVETISIFGIEASVGFDWNSGANNYSEKHFLRESRNSKKYRYLFRSSPDSSQYAIMAKSIDVQRPIIYAIIDEILGDKFKSESFIFYKKVTDDEVWYFQSSKDGLVISGDIIVPMDDFLDILDEHILVSDYPDDMLHIYTDSPDEIKDISEVIKYQLINIEAEVLNALEFKIIKVSGLFGVGFGYYFFFIFMLILYFAYSYIDSIIEIPEYPAGHHFKKVAELEEPIEWKVLSSITDKSFSDQVFISKYLSVISTIPVNIRGWDVKSINYKGDKIVILYKMSKRGKDTITKIRPLLKKHLIDNGMDSKNIGFDYYALDGVLKIIIELRKKETIAGYKSIKEYKGKMGYNDYMAGIEKLKTYKAKYTKENQSLLRLVDNMRGQSYFTRLFYLVNGRWGADKELLNISVSNLTSIYSSYRKEYKNLPKLKPPEKKVMEKYAIEIVDIMKVYNYAQEVSAIKFLPSTSSFKDGSRVSTFQMKGIGLGLLKQKVEANKQIAPLRYKSAKYDWIKSLWEVEGVMYEME